MFITYLFKDIRFFIFWIVIAIISTCVHEFAHAITAYWQGDDTAKLKGYFTLNPMVHMGKQSLICLFLMGICWGACPVAEWRMRHRYSDAIVSFAGPFANFLQAIVYSFLYAIFVILFGKESPYPILQNIYYLFWIGSYLNTAFFLWNMIPIPPFDGSHILTYFCPNLKIPFLKMGERAFIFLFAIMVFIPFLGDMFWQFCVNLSSTFCNLFLLILELIF